MDDLIKISVPLNPDEEGMIGRECNNPDCKKYFKVKPGTSITENVKYLNFRIQSPLSF